MGCYENSAKVCWVVVVGRGWNIKLVQTQLLQPEPRTPV